MSCNCNSTNGTAAVSAESSSTQQTAAQTASSGATFAPACDITDSGAEYTLTADLPGTGKDQINVTFEDGVLSIRAGVASPAEGRAFLRREYGVGDFERQFRVGEDVDIEAISADYEQGVLTVRLPKAKAAASRQIAVRGA
jgi:HSP20 family protein